MEKSIRLCELFGCCSGIGIHVDEDVVNSGHIAATAISRNCSLNVIFILFTVELTEGIRFVLEASHIVLLNMLLISVPDFLKLLLFTVCVGHKEEKGDTMGVVV